MNAHTAFRLAMLENGYWPLLNDCKRSIEKGWPRQRHGSRSAAVGPQRADLDRDEDRRRLAVIDVDVSEGYFVEVLACAIDQKFPELFARGLVRHSGGAKEAWFARVDEPFARFASRRWYRGSDPDDPAVAKHLVECFGSRGTRQFGIDGPHSRNSRGEVISTYRFAGGASPATVPRASLPVLPKTVFAQACDLFDEIAAARGLTAVKEAKLGRRGSGAVLRTDADTEVDTQNYGPMTVTELERLMRERRKAANAPTTLRCSGTFHDPTRVRTDSHLINWGRYGLGIYDTMTETNWHRREWDASAQVFEFLGRLRETEGGAMDEFDGDAISRADREFLASLGEHPFKRDPRYGTPCPPRPNFGPFNATDPVQTAARLKHFEDVVTWMLANYAYREGAFISKGGAISLVDGEIIALADLRGRMAPWALIHVGRAAAPGALAGRRLDARRRGSPALNPPGGDAPRPAAPDLRGQWLRHIQPLPAPGAPGARG